MPNSLRKLLLTPAPFGLMRWFSVLSLVCIASSCIISSYTLSGFLKREMLQRDGHVMLDFVQSVADIENNKARAAGREPDVSDRTMEELFLHLSGVPDIIRTNIYAPDRRMAWSSRPELIGKHFNKNAELNEALRGKMAIETGITRKQKPAKSEHILLSNRPVHFVETYLPIRDRKTNTVIGVAELYRVPNALFDTIYKGYALIWLTGISSGLLLFGVLFWIVWRADHTMRAQQQQLVESETLAAVGEMGAAVAHGIRNPLASIRSSAELCVDDATSASTRESIGDIIKEVDRLEKWLRELLSYAQPDPDVVGSVRLRPLVERVFAHYQRRFDLRGVQATLAIDASLPEVVGDESAYEQAIANVLANAVEATPAGGRITVTLGAHGDGVRLVVSDTGIGIPEQQKSRLFTPFQTSKPKGMGLGLALVRRIVRRYGGEVRIDSVEGEGTTVALVFAAREVA